MASATRLAHHLRDQLQRQGYRVHDGGREGGHEHAGRFWFTWAVAGMTDSDVVLLDGKQMTYGDADGSKALIPLAEPI